MKKLLAITLHLSTGGGPQVLVKRIELIKDTYEIYVIEYSNISHHFVIQKNRIKNLIPPDNFFTLGDNKMEILDIIEKINPDFIHMEEIPEMFMDYNVAKQIYTKDRKYRIFETTHSSDYNVDNKMFFPDKFIFVSQYNCFKFNKFGIPTEVVEYPVDKKIRSTTDKNNALKKLGLDPNYKHVLNVGLFTPRKNQAYAFDIARELQNEKIKFHFVGNQAGNFEHYWKPLMNNKPDNCIIWGERGDVDDFYTACDLFLFTSRGFRYDKELNPLVIKEALQEDIPLFLFPLDVYCGKYDNSPDCTYMIGNATDDAKLVKDFLSKIVNDAPLDIVHIKPSSKIKIVQLSNNINIELKKQLNYLDIRYESSNVINYTDTPPKSNCLRPDDIGRIGINGLTANHYSNYLTYRRAIETNLTPNVDYLVILNENHNISNVKNILNRLDGISTYGFIDEILIINKSFKNLILSKYRTEGWDDTKKWLSSTQRIPYEDENIIDIKYDKDENKIIFGLINKTPKTVRYKLIFKDDSQFYTDDVNISNQFKTWVNVEHFKELKDVTIDFFRKGRISLSRKIELNPEIKIKPEIKQKESKNLFVLSTYIDSDIKKKTTIDCINSLKNEDILISSHIPLDNDIQNMVKYYIYDDYNPMIKHSLYNRFWNETDNYRIDINFDKLSNVDKLNQSLSALNNIENSVRMAKTLGYDRIINVTYDFIFSDEDLKTINDLSNEINKSGKEGFFMKFKDNNLDALKTVFFIIDVDLFLEIFDNVRTEDKYNEDCKILGVDNFLERYFYKKLENYYDRLLIKETNENNLFNGKINLFSGVEYLNVVPIKNNGVIKNNEFVLWLTTSNVVDDRTLVVNKYNNGKMVDTFDLIIKGQTKFYKVIELNNGDNIELRTMFMDNGNIISTENFGVINKDNVKDLTPNGSFIFKNTKNDNITTIIDCNENDDDISNVIKSVKSISSKTIVGSPNNDNVSNMKKIHNDVKFLTYEYNPSMGNISKINNNFCKGYVKYDDNWLLFIKSDETLIDSNFELIFTKLKNGNGDIFLFSDNDSPLLVKGNIVGLDSTPKFEILEDRYDTFINYRDYRYKNIENMFNIKLYDKINK